MYFRHRTTKAVEQATSSPGEDWVRIAGPERIDPAEVPTPGVQDAPTPERPPASGAGSGIAAWIAYGVSLGRDQAEMEKLGKAELIDMLTA